MRGSLTIAWRQLSHQRMKLAVAAAGVVVAVMLMLVQLGIRQGALDSSVAFAQRIDSDLVVVSPRTRTIFQPTPLPRRLLFRLPAHRQVQAVEEVYISQGRFRNPYDLQEYPVTIYGLDPRRSLLRLPGLSEFARPLELPDRGILDGLGRNSYTKVVADLGTQNRLPVEVNHRRVDLLGTIRVGVPISVDGALYTTNNNFLRMFPGRHAGAIDLGLVQLAPGADAAAVRDELRGLVGREARVLTRQELVEAEVRHVRVTAPIDFIFGMGVVVGFFIGFVVVYQILYTEVVNHLPQFATLKAMGFTNGYLLRVVLGQAAILSMLGYFPGAILAMVVYQITTTAIQMPVSMTAGRALGVLFTTLAMCGLSAMVAVRKARTADPADVF